MKKSKGNPNKKPENNAIKEKELFALVKWMSGEDKGRYSIIPTKWIKNFSHEEFLNECGGEEDETYVIEWKTSNKKPKLGWKVYDGLVVQVSFNQKELERTLNTIGGMKSEKDVDSDTEELQPPKSIGFSSKQIEKRSPPILLEKIAKPSPPTDADSSQEMASYSEELSECNSKNFTDQPVQLLKTLSGRVEIVQHSQSKLQADNQNMMELVNNLSKKIDTIVNLLNGDPDAVRKVQNIETGSKQYEIGREGSGIFVDEQKWSAICNKTSPTSMAIALVKSLFDTDVLLRSNLKGGASKCSKKEQDKGPKLHALDSKILEAIYDHVRMKFPNNYNRSQIGQSINNMLAKLRRESHVTEKGIPMEGETSD